MTPDARTLIEDQRRELKLVWPGVLVRFDMPANTPLPKNLKEFEGILGAKLKAESSRGIVMAAGTEVAAVRAILRIIDRLADPSATFG